MNFTRHLRKTSWLLMESIGSRQYSFHICNFRHNSSLHYLNRNCHSLSYPVSEQRILLMSGQEEFCAFYGIQRKFHTTARRQIPPILWLFVKPVAKLGAILGGRFARKKWQSLPPEERVHIWTRIKKNWMYILLGAGLLTGVGLEYYWYHLQEVPITHRKRFVAFTDQQFLKIAQFEANRLKEDLKESLLPADHPYVTVVTKVVERLVLSNQDIDQMQCQKWKVAVVESPEVMAFVMPTGEIFVYTGLLKFILNEDQLAHVIGHEMTHAILSHGAENLSFVQLIDFMIILVMAALWMFLPTDGIALVTQWFYNKVVELMIHLPYGRKLEKEADEVGLQLAAKACFDVREAVSFWHLMDINSDLEGTKAPEWLSTHPASLKRAEHLEYLLPKALSIMKDCHCAPLPENATNKVLIKELRQAVDNEVIGRKARRNLKNVQTIKQALAASS